MAKRLTPEDLRTYEDLGVIKWVRLSTGEYRFLDSKDGSEHKDLVDAGEEATDAGILFVYPEHGKWRMHDYGSMSLGIGCSAEADQGLDKILGLERRDEY